MIGLLACCSSPGSIVVAAARPSPAPTECPVGRGSTAARLVEGRPAMRRSRSPAAFGGRSVVGAPFQTEQADLRGAGRLGAAPLGRARLVEPVWPSRSGRARLAEPVSSSPSGRAGRASRGAGLRPPGPARPALGSPESWRLLGAAGLSAGLGAGRGTPPPHVACRLGRLDVIGALPPRGTDAAPAVTLGRLRCPRPGLPVARAIRREQDARRAGKPRGERMIPLRLGAPQ